MFRIVFFLMTFLLICPLSSFSRQNIIPPNENQKSLAKHAIFPEKEHKEWLEVQKNPGIDSASKIKCTVNTFFICINETMVKGTLQDFVFLFDRKNDHASLYYSYELGFMYNFLEGWKLINNLWKFYEYRPRFLELVINGKNATVRIHPRTGVVRSQYPYSVGSGFSSPYTFNLKEVDRLWLIQIAECSNEVHEAYPLGTDFMSQVEEMKKRQEDKKSIKEPQGDQKKSPSPEKLKEVRKIELYHEIFGNYRFVVNEKILLISFFTKDRHLFGQYENIPEIPLFPVNDNSLEFEWRPESPYDKIYKLRFIQDQAGKITKCLIHVEGQSYEGTKLKGPCYLYRY